MLWVQMWPWIMVHLGVAWVAAWALGYMPQLWLLEGAVSGWVRRFRTWMEEPERTMGLHFVLPWVRRGMLLQLLMGVLLLLL